MARRRINMRFVGIVLLILVGAVGILMGARRFLVRDSAESYINAGKLCMAERQWEKAANNFSRASGMDPTNPELIVMWGDAYYQWAQEQPDMIGRDRMVYERALQIRSDYEPALRRLLTSYVQESQMRPSAAAFSHIRETAERLSAVRPGDLQVKAYIPISSIQAWMAGLTAADASQVDDAIQRLEELIPREPGNADLPFHLATAHIHRAGEYQREDRSNDAARELAEAAKIFDEVLKTQDQNPAAHFRAFQIYSRLAAVEGGSRGEQKYGPRMRTALERAQLLVKSSEPLYMDISLSAASAARSRGERDEAEKILREVHQKFSNDPRIRLVLAQFLGEDPARREEAIQLLTVRPQGEGYQGIRSAILGRLEIDYMLALTSLRIDACPSVSDQMQRQAMQALISDGYSKVANKLSEADPRVMWLKGKLLRFKGKNVEAIQVLEQLANLQQAQGVRDDRMLFMLAQAYMDTNQAGPARTHLTDILDRNANFHHARVLLARLLIQENAIEAAKAEVATLEHSLKGVPEVVKLRMALLGREDPKGHADQIRECLKLLPETDRVEIGDKAQQALTYGINDEAIRLLKEMKQFDPGEPLTTGLLAQAYMRDNKPEEARQVVATARKVNPVNTDLQLLEQQLLGTNPRSLHEVQVTRIRAMPDEFAREMAFYRLAMEEGNHSEALSHLHSAEKLKPADAQVWEQLFQHYLAEEKWDHAERYMARLIPLGRDQAGGQLYRYRLAMAKKDYGAAVTIGRELTRDWPHFAQSWMALADPLRRTGQLDEALSSYVAAMDRQPDNSDAYQGIILCYFGMNRPQEANRYIREAHARFPAQAWFLEQRINYDLMYSATPEDALEPRQEMLKKNPHVANNWLALARAYIRCAQKRLAIEPDKGGKHLAEAKRILQEALAKWPDERAFYGELANVASYANDFAGGEIILKQLGQRPAWQDKPDPWLMLAEYYSWFSKFEEAEKSLRLAQAKAPQSVEIQIVLASWLMRQRKFDESLAVTGQNSENPKIQKQRIEVLIAAGRLEQAHHELLTVLATAVQSHRADLLSLLARVHLSRGDLDEAAKAAKEAIKLDAAHPWATYYLGLICLQKQQGEEALKYLVPLRDQNANNGDFRLALYRAYQLVDDSDSAIRELEAAVRVIPQNKPLRMRLLENYMSSRPPRLMEALSLLREVRATPEGRSDPEWLNAEASYWLARRDFEQALQLLKPALNAASVNPLLIRTYLNVLYEAGDYQALLNDTANIISSKDNKGIWWVYRMRAMARLKLKDSNGALNELDGALADAMASRDDQAMETIVEVIAQDIGLREALDRILPRVSKEVRWRMAAAQLFHTAGDDAQALALVRQTLAEFNRLTAAEQEGTLRVAGSIFMTCRPAPMVNEAMDVFRRLLERSPEDPITLRNIAWLLAEVRKPPDIAESLNCGKRAYVAMQRADRNIPLIIDTYGWILTLNGHAEDAIGILRPLAMKDRSPLVHYHLAEAYLKQSMTDDALSQLDMAQELMRKTKQAKKPTDVDLEAKIEEALGRANRQASGEEKGAADLR